MKVFPIWSRVRRLMTTRSNESLRTGIANSHGRVWDSCVRLGGRSQLQPFNNMSTLAGQSHFTRISLEVADISEHSPRRDIRRTFLLGWEGAQIMRVTPALRCESAKYKTRSDFKKVPSGRSYRHPH
jgi:hypothetical protein